MKEDNNITSSLTLEAKRLKKELSDRDEICRFITGSAVDAIISIDEKEKIFLWNPAAEKLFGYAASEIIGKPLTLLMPDRYKKGHKKGFSKYIDTGKSNIVGKNHEVCALRKDGSEVPVELSVGSWKKDGKIYLTGIVRDITLRKKIEQDLRETSITDELTGLLNRRGFFTLAEKQYEVAKRSKRNFSIMFLDLDEMKEINDRFGHTEGDQALKDLAHILRNTFRASDIVARIGGDEFTVLMTEPRSSAIEKTVSRNIQEQVIRYNKSSDSDFMLSVSLGFAHFDPFNPGTLDELLSAADSAMYEHKQQKQSGDTIPAGASKKERRKAKRTPAANKVPVELVLSDNIQLKDISKTGLCLATPAPLHRNDLYQLKIPFKSRGTLTPAGVVVWSATVHTSTKQGERMTLYEAGLKFVDLDKGQQASLKEFIAAL